MILVIILCVSLFFSGCAQECVYQKTDITLDEIEIPEETPMGLVNISTATGTVAWEGEGQIDEVPGSYDPRPNVVDGDKLTGASWYAEDTGGGNRECVFSVTLNDYYDVYKIGLVLRMPMNSSHLPNGIFTTFEYYDIETSSWKLIAENDWAKGGSVVYINTEYKTWFGYKKIKDIRMRCEAYSNTDFNGWMLKLYEIQVYAEDLFNSGIKVSDNSGTYKLARNLYASGSLRYRDQNNFTRSLALVEPSSQFASPVRIQTLSGVKAIAKYEGAL